MISIVEQIFLNGVKNPYKVALQNEKQSLTYAQLLHAVLIAKKTLQSNGVGQGDRVVIFAEKKFDFIAIYFACHMLEAVTCPLATDTNAARFEFIESIVRPKLIVASRSQVTHTLSKTLYFDDFNLQSDLLFDEVNDLSIDRICFPNAERTADIVFTTGTTGTPKGVQLSHKNLTAAASNINTFIKNKSTDVEMVVLPLSHSFGLGRLRCALSNGQCVVLLNNFVNIKKFYRFLEEFKVNGFGMVAANFEMLKKFSGYKLREYGTQLHYIEIGSAPMPLEDKKLLVSLLPQTRICMHYGLTEASRSSFMEFHDDFSRLNTIGKASPNVLIRICNEAGDEVGDGEDGEICVSGDCVTKGYLNHPSSDSFFKDFFRTGDLGVKLDNGYIVLKGRKK